MNPTDKQIEAMRFQHGQMLMSALGQIEQIIGCNRTASVVCLVDTLATVGAMYIDHGGDNPELDREKRFTGMCEFADKLKSFWQATHDKQLDTSVASGVTLAPSTDTPN